MTASEYQSQMVPFAMELANRISLRLEHHNSLTSFEIEDIEQELLIIGSGALRLHGIDWEEGDLDIWLDPNLSDEDWQTAVNDAAGSLKRLGSEANQTGRVVCVHRLVSPGRNTASFAPKNGLTADEFQFYVRHLAIEADRFEYMLSGRDTH